MPLNIEKTEVQGSLKMDDYLFWTPVALVILTTNCLKDNNAMMKCTTKVSRLVLYMKEILSQF